MCKRQGATRSALRKWNKEVFEKCQDRISTILHEIKLIQDRDNFDNNGSNESKLQAELTEWLIRSEILWRQKSSELWLKHGDKNSKFFHFSSIIQRRRNNIDDIKLENGSWICESSQIRNHFLKGFKSLFSTNYVSFPTNLENLITPAITQEENDILSCIPSPELIKQTLFQMQDLKALGPDCFPAVFYKDHWPIVGKTVTKAVTSFFVSDIMPKEVNSSLIVLIPNSQCPISFNNFRPISLCNVV